MLLKLVSWIQMISHLEERASFQRRERLYGLFSSSAFKDTILSVMDIMWED